MSKVATCYCDVPGARLAYVECGAGQPVLFVHGNSSDKSFFNRYLQDLAPRCHCYALDSRCHGETVCATEGLSYAQIADDVIAFCGEQGIEQAQVVGFSDGGIVALLLAAKAPDLFPVLIAVSPNYLASGLTPGGYRLMAFSQTVTRAMQKLGLNVDRAVARGELVLSDSGLTDADLAQIGTKVHLVSAERDMISHEHLQRIASLVPGITWHTIPSSNHLSIMFKRRTRELIAGLLGERATAP